MKRPKDCKNDSFEFAKDTQETRSKSRIMRGEQWCFCVQEGGIGHVLHILVVYCPEVIWVCYVQTELYVLSTVRHIPLTSELLLISTLTSSIEF